MIVDMISNKKLNPVLTELLVMGRKRNISLGFIKQSYFAVSKNNRLNSKYYIIMKISNKRELQQIAFNRLWDIKFQDFESLQKRYCKTMFSLVINSTLQSDNLFNVSERNF